MIQMNQSDFGAKLGLTLRLISVLDEHLDNSNIKICYSCYDFITGLLYNVS